MKLGYVNSIKNINAIGERLDYMEITIDNVPYKMFGDYAKTSRYLDMSVVFDTAPDLYQGKMIERIVDIAEERVITTAKADVTSKLLPDNGDINPVCNFEIGSMPMGSKQSSVVLYLSSYVESCSDKARWYDLKVVDMVSKVYTLRYFSSFSIVSEETREALNSFVGHYIKTDIVYNQYGYQVQNQSEIEVLTNEVVLKPEVEIACSIILNECRKDEVLMEYLRSYMFIAKLKEVIDIEPGYHLVQIAMELSLINALGNITDTFVTTTLVRAAITSRGYLIDRKNDFSKPILNVNKVLRSSLKNDLELINILDAASPNTNSTKRMYIYISKFVKYIMNERRGLINEEEIINEFNAVSSMFGGLL